MYSFGIVLLELLTGRTPVDMERPSGEGVLLSWVWFFELPYVGWNLLCFSFSLSECISINQEKNLRTKYPFVLWYLILIFSLVTSRGPYSCFLFGKLE